MIGPLRHRHISPPELLDLITDLGLALNRTPDCRLEATASPVSLLAAAINLHMRHGTSALTHLVESDFVMPGYAVIVHPDGKIAFSGSTKRMPREDQIPDGSTLNVNPIDYLRIKAASAAMEPIDPTTPPA